MNTFSKILSTVSLGAALCFAGPVVSSVSAQSPGARGPGTAQAPDGARRGPPHGAHGRRGHMHRGHGQPFAELNLTEAQRTEMRAIHQRSREAMQNVLTPEQRARMQELRTTRAREHLDRRVAHMTERLSLTPTQAQQVRNIFSQADAQRRAIFEQSRTDETSPREALEALRTRTQAQLDAVLSAEQRSALGELRSQRGERGQRGPRGGGEGGERGPRGPRGAR
ncbi:MAG: hypothetical protein KF729_11600 [Sandaracinaceae bacterium]|nr:hypothetical protein [Sandaracinaceae bacterium]